MNISLSISPEIVRRISQTDNPILQQDAFSKVKCIYECQDLFGNFEKSMRGYDELEIKEILNIFCSFPDYYYNSVKDDKTDKFNLKSYFKSFLNLPVTKYSNKLIAIITTNYFLKGHFNVICEAINEEFENISVEIFFKKLPLENYERIMGILITHIKPSKVIKEILISQKSDKYIQLRLSLIKRMLFLEYYNLDFIHSNLRVLIYLLDAVDRIDIFNELLYSWSNESSLKKVSIDQHIYITKMMLHLFGCFESEKRRELLESNNLAIFLSGMQEHLKTNQSEIILVGMVIGEIFGDYIYKSDKKLQFEYRDNDLSKSLKAILQIKIEEKPVESVEKVNSEESSYDDSDDSEFEVMNTGISEQLSISNSPMYIRECLDFITNPKRTENLDYLRDCISSLEYLLIKDVEMTMENAEDYCQTVLHMQNECGLDNFGDIQQRCLILITCLQPESIAKYLIREFYDKTNGVNIRYFVLSILVKSTHKLAGVDMSGESIGGKSNTSVDLFSKNCQHFFYPLLDGTFPADILSEPFKTDPSLYCRYLYTLAMFVYCSSNATGFIQMCRQFLAYLKDLCGDKDREDDKECREAIQVSLGLVFVCLCDQVGDSVLDGLFDALMDWRMWLGHEYDRVGCVEIDSDMCELIGKNLCVLDSVIKKAGGGGLLGLL